MSIALIETNSVRQILECANEWLDIDDVVSMDYSDNCKSKAEVIYSERRHLGAEF